MDKKRETPTLPCKAGLGGAKKRIQKFFLIFGFKRNITKMSKLDIYQFAFITPGIKP